MSRSALLPLCLLLAGSVCAQVPWVAGAESGWESFPGSERSAWRYAGVRVGIDPEAGFFSIELRRSERREVAESILIGDAYLRLWQGAYANLRIAASPDAVVHPETDVLLELFQSLGGGYVPALQLRRMAFANASAVIISPALARYAGKWYVRLQGTFSDPGQGLNAFGSWTLRRLITPTDDFWEVKAGFGREVISTGFAEGFRSGRSWSAAVRWQLRAGDRFLWAPGLLVADDAVLGTRLAGTLSLTLRRP